MTTLTMTPETALILRVIVQDYLATRSDSETYVNQRYAHMSEAFRQHKIADVKHRVGRMDALLEQLSEV
jgi:hypothetical protein